MTSPRAPETTRARRRPGLQPGGASGRGDLRGPLEPRQEQIQGLHFYLYRFIARPRYQIRRVRFTFDYFRQPETRQGPRSSILDHPARPFWAGKAFLRFKTVDLKKKHRQFEVLPKGRVGQRPKIATNDPQGDVAEDYENQRRQQSNLGVIGPAAYGSTRGADSSSRPRNRGKVIAIKVHMRLWALNRLEADPASSGGPVCPALGTFHGNLADLVPTHSTGSRFRARHKLPPVSGSLLSGSVAFLL